MIAAPDKQYWNNAIISLDRPTERHYEVTALDMNQCLAKVGKLPPEYAKHIYEYRGTTGLGRNGSSDSLACFVVGACCIVGAMPDSITSRPDFKEIPWPKLS